MSLASKLNNRIEIWGKIKEETDLGITYEEQLLKKVWADVKPISGSSSSESGNTTSTSVKFKIRIRKTDISTDNWIIYNGMRYEIDYVYQDFNRNSFLDVEARLKGE